MKSSFFKSWKTDTIIFSRKINRDELLSILQDYIRTNKKLSFTEKITDWNNLDISVKSNYEIEVQPFWQFLRFSGFGMTAKMKGKLYVDGDKTIIEMIISINNFLKFIFLVFPLLLIIISVTNDFNLTNIVVSFVSSFLISFIFLFYFKTYRDNLIKSFADKFDLQKE